MQDLKYRAHVATKDWQPEVGDGNIAGTVSQNLALEAFQITGYDIPGLGIYGQAYIQDTGWLNPVMQGEIVGTTGKAKHIEAVKLWLFGDEANNYTIWYRLHVSNYGFLPWVRNGEQSGTVGGNIQAEAIQIILVSNNEFFWPASNTTTPFLDLTPQPPAVNLPDKIVADAVSWVGYISEGGSDYSVFGQGDWCCKFVRGIYQNNGIDFPNTDWVPTVVNWAQSNGRWTNTPQKGFAIIYDFNENGTGDHIGIVEEVYSNNHVLACEGNTDQGNGIGVYQVDRSYGILGYVNPF